MIKARFYVAEVTKQAGGQYGRVTLNAVTRKTGDDNVDWAHATPSGTYTMTVHKEALAVFDGWLGQDVSISIEPIAAE